MTARVTSSLELVAAPAPSDLPARMLAVVAAQRCDADLEEALSPLLDVLVALDAPARVTLRLRPGVASGADPEAAPELCFTRVSGDDEVGTGAWRTLQHDLPGGLVHGSLELFIAGPSQLDGEHGRDALERAAAILALVASRCQARHEHARDRAHTTQLEKLASIGQVVASIVHELNNPLTAILAYAEHLQRQLGARGLGSEADRAGRILEAAERIHGFSRELIEYSRPAAPLTVPTDLHSLIDRALRFCAHMLRGADITVERSYRDLPVIHAVEAKLTQVFVNLITNAVHAMGERGGTLQIRTWHDADAQTVGVSIADDGAGIDPQHVDRIFEAYFTTKPAGAGVGLGLTIVHQAIVEHRGRIRAERREPHGSVFTVELPVGA